MCPADNTSARQPDEARVPAPPAPPGRLQHVLGDTRRERWTSPVTSAGYSYARSVGVYVTLTLTLGCSPWRLRPDLTTPRLPSRTVAAGAACCARYPPH